MESKATLHQRRWLDRSFHVKAFGRMAAVTLASRLEEALEIDARETGRLLADAAG